MSDAGEECATGLEDCDWDDRLRCYFELDEDEEREEKTGDDDGNPEKFVEGEAEEETDDCGGLGKSVGFDDGRKERRRLTSVTAPR